jgi:hypothetical protein
VKREIKKGENKEKDKYLSGGHNKIVFLYTNYFGENDDCLCMLTTLVLSDQ